MHVCTVVGQSAKEAGADKLKGFVKPRRSLFAKWQATADKAFDDGKADKGDNPKIKFKSKDDKAWMVQF